VRRYGATKNAEKKSRWIGYILENGGLRRWFEEAFEMVFGIYT